MVKLDESSWENPAADEYQSAKDKSEADSSDHHVYQTQGSIDVDKSQEYGHFVADADRPGYQTILNRL